MSVPKLIISSPQEPIFVGDTWDGFTFEYKEDDVAVNLTGATIRMTLKSDTGGTITLSSTNSGFVITTPAAGIFSCAKVSRMDYPPGTYLGDLEITLANNDRITPILVQIFLKDDTTK
jgi:hypothetical protein